MTLALHRLELQQQSRCGSCAELVPFRTILAGTTCPRCGAEPPAAEANLDGTMDRLTAGWQRWRALAYGGLGLSLALASVVPLLSPLAFVFTVVGIQLFLIRRPIRWLGLYRRVATRLTLKLFMAALAFVNLVVSVAVFPLFGVAQVVCGVMNVVMMAAYLEGSLAFLRNRLRREAVTTRLDAWEVALPVSMIGGLLLVAAGVVLAASALLHLLLESDLPGLSQIARFLVEEGGR